MFLITFTKINKNIKTGSSFGLCRLISSLFRYFVFLLLLTLSGFPLGAQPVVSGDSLPSFEIDARGRNGNTGFEGALFTPGTPPPGEPGGAQWQMNPSGAPVWNSNGNVYGNMHSFRLRYEKAIGKTTWNIDFNRDGDFDNLQETVSKTDSILAGKGFQYVNLWAQGNNNGLTASVSDFTINGHPMGSFASNSDTAVSVLFTETQGYFGDIAISGQLSFSGNGGQERPRVWVRLGKAGDGGAGEGSLAQVSVPALSNTYVTILVLLFLVLGGFLLFNNRKSQLDLSKI